MTYLNCGGCRPTKAFLFTIVFLIQLILSNAALHNDTEAQNMHQLAPRFTVNRFGCDAEQTAMIQVAMNGAKQAFRRAIIRTTAVDDLVRRQPAAATDIEPYDMVSWRTFEAIFGQVFYGRNHPSNYSGRGTVDAVKRVLEGVSNAFNDNSFAVEIMCKDPWGEGPDPDKDPKFKWDDRPAERGGQQYVDSPPSCEREFNGYSRTHEDTPAHGDLFLIVLCPSVFEVEEDVGPLSEIAREKLEPGEMATSDFANSLSETVIHELFHSSMFLGKEALMDVQMGPIDGYSWDSVIYFGREWSELAIQNAQSYAFFVSAMYLDLYDWRTGFNEFIDGPEEPSSCPRE